MPSYDRALWALRTWLDSWPGVGHVAAGMHRQGYDLQLSANGAPYSSIHSREIVSGIHVFRPTEEEFVERLHGSGPQGISDLA